MSGCHAEINENDSIENKIEALRKRVESLEVMLKEYDRLVIMQENLIDSLNESLEFWKDKYVSIVNGQQLRTISNALHQDPHGTGCGC